MFNATIVRVVLGASLMLACVAGVGCQSGDRMLAHDEAVSIEHSAAVSAGERGAGMVASDGLGHQLFVMNEATAQARSDAMFQSVLAGSDVQDEGPTHAPAPATATGRLGVEFLDLE